MGEMAHAISDNAKAWASGAVQRIGTWIQGAASGAPAGALGLAGALLGALALWKAGGHVRRLLGRSSLPAVLYVDSNKSVDLQKCRAWAERHLRGAALPTEAQLDAILPPVDPSTRHTWTQYYAAQRGSSDSQTPEETTMDKLLDFRKSLIELLRQPPAPTTPPVAFILRTPRVEATLRAAEHSNGSNWPISPIQWLYENYRPQSDIWDAKDPNDLLREQTPDTIRTKLQTMDPRTSDGSRNWVLVPPSADYAYPIEPMWTTQTPCPARAAAQAVTFWTQQQSQDSENYVDPDQDALTVAWTQNGARAEATTAAAGRVLAGSGVVQWSVQLAPPCLEPMRDVHNIFEVSFDGNVIDRLEWTAARGDVGQVRDTVYIQFDRIPWGAWKTTPDALRALLPPGFDDGQLQDITFQHGAEQASVPAVMSSSVDTAVGENTEITYGDKGGPYVWDFEEKPWEAPQYTDQHRAPPQGWSSLEKAEQYRQANLRLFTLLHMQRVLRPLAERAAGLLQHYRSLDLPNSANSGIDSGCHLRTTLEQAQGRAEYLQTVLASCLDTELQGVDIHQYKADTEEIPGTSDLKRENAQLQRRLQLLEQAVAAGRVTQATPRSLSSPSRLAAPAAAARRRRGLPPRAPARIPAAHNDDDVTRWLSQPEGAGWRRLRNMRADTPAAPRGATCWRACWRRASGRCPWTSTI